MKTLLVKRGKRMALRIPKAIAEDANLRPRDHLELAVEDSGTLRIRKKKYKKLGKLLRGITPENRHGEIDWGKPAG